MINVVFEMLQYVFIRRALLVGTLISLCAALLGVSLVLKKYSMIGDGLSHVGFGVLAVAVAVGWSPLFISIPIVVLAAILLLKIGTKSKTQADSAIGIISSSSLAIGVSVTSITTGLNTDVWNYMFGSILAMSKIDVIMSLIVSLIVILLFIVYYRKIFAVTFDENFAKASGLNVTWYTNLIAILTAVIIVIGMRMMGTLLISSIIIFPAITSMRLFKTFKKVVISSAMISIFSFLIGMYFSYIFSISTGAMIVIVNLFLFIVFTLIDKIIYE